MFISLYFFINLIFAPTPDLLGKMTAQNFMDHLQSGDIHRAGLLMDDTVNFDGTIIKGRAHIEDFLSTRLNILGGKVTWSYVKITTGQDAKEKFGPLPKRLSNIELKGSIVALGRRPGGGVAAILKDKGNGTWRVVALTD